MKDKDKELVWLKSNMTEFEILMHYRIQEYPLLHKNLLPKLRGLSIDFNVHDLSDINKIL